MWHVLNCSHSPPISISSRFTAFLHPLGSAAETLSFLYRTKKYQNELGRGRRELITEEQKEST